MSETRPDILNTTAALSAWHEGRLMPSDDVVAYALATSAP